MTSSSPAIPFVKATSIIRPGGGEAVVLEISTARPPKSAVAIVLDLSDSCPRMDTEIARLPRLLSVFPRSWSVWIYRLSDPSALNAEELNTVGHLVDGALTLDRWTNDRHLLAISHAAGSFVGPVMNAIEARSLKESIGRVTTLILTDGQLADWGPADIPQSMCVVGLSCRTAPQRPTQWTRIFPATKLYVLADPSLERALESETGSFFGNCTFTWQLANQELPHISRLDCVARSLRPVTQNQIDFSLSEGSLYLLAEMTHELMRDLRISCTPLRTGRAVPLAVTVTADAPPVVIDLIRSAWAASHAMPSDDLIVDIGSNDATQMDAWNWFCHATALAEDRQPWVVSGQWVTALRNSFLERLTKAVDRVGCDAVLCLGNAGSDVVASAERRVVIIGLHRYRNPSLQWNANAPLKFGTAIENIEIRYDRMEARWMMRWGANEAVEINPRGSERFSQPVIRTGQSEWFALFSGNLKP